MPPHEAKVNEVKLVSRDVQGARTIETKTEGATISFAIPEVKVYTVAVMSW